MIFLDTSILSISYRRKYRQEVEKPFEVKLLEKMIENNEPLFLQRIVLQEFLSSLKEEAQFQKLYQLGEYFPLVMATKQYHIEAAKIANICRSQGVTTSTIDCLIAAITLEQKAQLFTTDQDFRHMARYCPLRLFSKSLKKA